MGKKDFFLPRCLSNFSSPPIYHDPRSIITNLHNLEKPSKLKSIQNQPKMGKKPFPPQISLPLFFSSNISRSTFNYHLHNLEKPPKLKIHPKSTKNGEKNLFLPRFPSNFSSPSIYHDPRSIITDLHNLGRPSKLKSKLK